MDTFLINSLIREMEQTFDLATILQCGFIELGNYRDAAKEESAKGLAEEILQSCKAAISLLNSWKSDNDAKPKRKGAIEFASRVAAPADIDQIGAQRYPKRRCTAARKEVTVAPYDDGHQWRKYGEKSIKGSSFKRSYYRCTYSEDQRCEAKKKVQQQDSSSYLVLHEGRHTCSNNNSSRVHGGVTQMVPSVQGLLPPSLPRAAAATTSSAPIFDISGGCEVNTVRRDTVQGAFLPKRESLCSMETSNHENPTDEFVKVEPLQPGLYDIPGIGDGNIALAEASSPCSSSSLGFFDMEELLAGFEFDGLFCE